MRTAEDILYLYRQRKDRLTPMHKNALDVRAAYYGEITLPIPEIDRNEKPLVANLVLSAGEQKSMRVASTMPDIYYPSINPGTALYDKRARNRTLVNLAWWDRDRMKLKMRKRARHMVYYASSAVMLRPNFKEERPTWQIRNPLTTLPPEMDVGDVSPEDIIFTYAKSYAWLQRKYPAQIQAFGLQADVQDGVFTILEYQDEADTVLLAVGDKVDASRSIYPQSEPMRQEIIVELERSPNRVGKCTAIILNGIGLEHPRGSFDGTIGMWQALGKLMALEAIGMQRSIWPEEWLIDDPTGDGAKIITPADPLHGVVGHVTGGKLQEVMPQMNQQGPVLMDRMERGIRIEAGIPSELGGESASNIRTGKRGDAVMAAVLDFPIQEMQELLSVALQEEDKIAVEIDKVYFPTRKSAFMSATGGQIDYQASQLWEQDASHYVKYAHAGVDAQGLVIEGAQRIGTGTLSKRSFMEMDPLVEDAQAELDRITVEHLRDALLNGLTQMAADPQMAPIVAQATIEAKGSENEIEHAVLLVHQALQQQQAEAAQQQQMAMAGGGGPPGPEGQPGMAQPTPAIAPPPVSLQNLTANLNLLRKGPLANVPNQLGIAS